RGTVPREIVGEQEVGERVRVNDRLRLPHVHRFPVPVSGGLDPSADRLQLRLGFDDEEVAVAEIGFDRSRKIPVSHCCACPHHKGYMSIKGLAFRRRRALSVRARTSAPTTSTTMLSAAIKYISVRGVNVRSDRASGSDRGPTSSSARLRGITP